MSAVIEDECEFFNLFTHKTNQIMSTIQFSPFESLYH
jgi:hypothetical protein